MPALPSALRNTRRTANITCQVVRLRDFRLVADRVENLSENGLLVGPADPVLTGDEVIVSMRVPWLADWIDLEAVVTRVVHGRRPGETSRSLGLSVTGMDDWSRRLFAAYQRRLVPVPPRYRVTWRGSPRFEARLALCA